RRLLTRLRSAARACLPMIWGVGGDDRAYDACGGDFGWVVGRGRSPDALGCGSGGTPVRRSSVDSGGDRGAVPYGCAVAGSARRFRAVADGLETPPPVFVRRHLSADLR